jgi:hypothetical protein
MTEKVKRGLGLLVVAVIGWLLVAVATENSTAWGSGPVAALEFLGCALLLLGVVGGLGLLAWGLLRD